MLALELVLGLHLWTPFLSDVLWTCCIAVEEWGRVPWFASLLAIYYCPFATPGSPSFTLLKAKAPIQYHSSGAIPNQNALSIDRGLHPESVAREPGCCDVEGLLEGGSLHRYGEARRSGA
jgi:hypothetical protein